MSSRHRSDEIRKRPKTNRKGLWVLVCGLFLLFASVGSVGAYIAFDSVDIEPVKCDVKAAHVERRGGGGNQVSTESIVVTSSECGKIELNLPQTVEQMKKTAKHFKRDSIYEFDMGWTSRNITPHIPGDLPSSKSYRLVD